MLYIKDSFQWVYTEVDMQQNGNTKNIQQRAELNWEIPNSKHRLKTFGEQKTTNILVFFLKKQKTKKQLIY